MEPFLQLLRAEAEVPGKTTPSPLPSQEEPAKEGPLLVEARSDVTPPSQAERLEPREERRRLLELPETQASAELAAAAEHTSRRSPGWLEPQARPLEAAVAEDLPLTTAMPQAQAETAASAA